MGLCVGAAIAIEEKIMKHNKGTRLRREEGTSGSIRCKDHLKKAAMKRRGEVRRIGADYW
jgi:hypothetical protein